jgi:hypothetical protein
MNNTQYESLFTDLTSEQAAVVEGGVNTPGEGGGQGSALTLYSRPNTEGRVLGRFDFGGRSVVSRAGQDMSSMIIKRGRWEFYSLPNFRGKSGAWGPGTHNLASGGLDNSVKSFRRIA